MAGGWHWHSQYLRFAGRREHQSKQHAHGRGFARTVRAEESVHVARPEFQVHAVDSMQSAVELVSARVLRTAASVAAEPVIAAPATQPLPRPGQRSAVTVPASKKASLRPRYGVINSPTGPIGTKVPTFEPRVAAILKLLRSGLGDPGRAAARLISVVWRRARRSDGARILAVARAATRQAKRADRRVRNAFAAAATSTDSS